MTTADFVLSAIGFIFIAVFGEGVVLFLGYLVFSIFSFGFVRIQGAEDANRLFPWHGFARRDDGKLIVEEKVASLVGAFFLIAAALIFFAWRTGAIWA